MFICLKSLELESAPNSSYIKDLRTQVYRKWDAP